METQKDWKSRKDCGEALYSGLAPSETVSSMKSYDIVKIVKWNANFCPYVWFKNDAEQFSTKKWTVTERIVMMAILLVYKKRF